MLQSIKQNQAAMAASLGGCQSRTSIFPVTAAEIKAVRRSCIKLIADLALEIEFSKEASDTSKK
jgi:predicted RNA-binding protein with PUA-like domain